MVRAFEELAAILWRLKIHETGRLPGYLTVLAIDGKLYGSGADRANQMTAATAATAATVALSLEVAHLKFAAREHKKRKTGKTHPPSARGLRNSR